jgi:hypothetical protein
MQWESIVLTILAGLASYTLAALVDMRQQIRDLHRWHAPDDKGRQSWRDPGPVLDRLDRVAEQIAELVDEMREERRRGSGGRGGGLGRWAMRGVLGPTGASSVPATTRPARLPLVGTGPARPRSSSPAA